MKIPSSAANALDKNKGAEVMQTAHSNIFRIFMG
jgi:hypothetical protein